MCDQCELEIETATSNTKTRIKLWQMPRHYHCPIIGTCLSMAELTKVRRNCTLPLPPNPRDHQLHTVIVGQAEHNGATAHRLHKLLDRKFQRWIKAYSQLRSLDEQRQFWSEALRHGELSGPFWALLSHSHSCRKLVDQVLGDVHMLSHLQGASNRADLKHSSALEQQVAELQQQLEQQRQQFELKLAKKEQRLAAQECDLAAMQARSIPAKKPERPLRQQLAEAHQAQRLLSRKQTWLVAQLAQCEHRLAELKQGHTGLIEQIEEAHQERDTLERALQQLLLRLAPAEQPNHPSSDTEAIDLSGKRLAYIGGRPTLYPHLRSYVETLNGQLTLHDGGQEDSRADLCNSLSGADLVFCPIDCVSHDACLRVKKFCKQHQKPFVPLRSASLSAFSNGLRWANQRATGAAPGGIITHSTQPLALPQGGD